MRDNEERASSSSHDRHCMQKPHRLRKVGVKLQHVVELLLKFCWLQSFVLIVL